MLPSRFLMLSIPNDKKAMSPSPFIYLTKQKTITTHFPPCGF